MRLKLALVFLFLNPLSPALSMPPQKTIAFITDVKGAVTLRRGTRQDKITQTAFLHEGDIVSTGDDGQALLWQVYSKVQVINPKTSKPITQMPLSSEPDVITPNRYLQLESRAISSARDIKRPSPRKQGGSEESLFLTLSPRFSLVLDSGSSFEWTPMKSATSYVVALYDAMENKIWESETKETRISYPDPSQNKAVKKLLPGNYAWDVTARIKDKSEKYDAARFTIAGDEEAQKIRTALSNARNLIRDKGATNLVYITACMEYQQYPEAESAIKQAISHNQNDQMLRILLMQVYEYMQRPDEREDLRAPFKDMEVADLESKLGIQEMVKTNK